MTTVDDVDLQSATKTHMPKTTCSMRWQKKKKRKKREKKEGDQFLVYQINVYDAVPKRWVFRAFAKAGFGAFFQEDGQTVPKFWSDVLQVYGNPMHHCMNIPSGRSGAGNGSGFMNLKMVTSGL